LKDVSAGIGADRRSGKERDEFLLAKISRNPLKSIDSD
jgi:hypothetical protein